MPLLESSIARLMLVVLTVAIGLTAMRTQSDFWFGILVSAVAVWFMVAVSAVVVARESHRRPFWSTFLAAWATALLIGFGPWSDASLRGSVPYDDAQAMATYASQVLPTTKALLRLRSHVPTSPRVAIQTLDRNGRATALIEVSAPPEHRGDTSQLVFGLTQFVDEDIRFSSTFKPGYATRRVVLDSSRVYLDAGYLLASLLIGAAAGATGSMYQSLRVSPRVANQGPDAVRGRGGAIDATGRTARSDLVG